MFHIANYNLYFKLVFVAPLLMLFLLMVACICCLLSSQQEVVFYVLHYTGWEEVSHITGLQTLYTNISTLTFKCIQYKFCILLHNTSFTSFFH